MPRCFFPVMILCAWLPLCAPGQTINWTGAVSTDWDNSTNWSPQQVPTATDHVVIAAGNVNFPVDGVFGILDWTGGQLSGPVTVPANATLNWQAGTLWINSSLTVGSNGVLNLSGSSDKYLYSPLTNAGTVTWSGTGNIQLGYWYNYNWYYAPIYNLAGALFDLQSDQTLLNDAFPGTQPFSNAGVLRKSAGSGSSLVNVPFLNTGDVQVQSGTLTLQGGGTLDGTFTATNGAGITFANGTFNLRSGNPANNGPGPVQFGAAAYLAFSGPITNFDFTAGYLTGDSVVTGTMNWSGGTLWQNSSLTVASNGVLTVSGLADRYLYGPLTNAGTITWGAAGDVYLGDYYNYNLYSAPIYNLVGALFDIQSDQTWYNGAQANSQPFSNAGVLRKSAGAGSSFINVPLANTGTVQAQSGTLVFQGGGTLDGTFGASNSAGITFANGTFNLQSGNPANAGSGPVQFGAAAYLVFSGPITNFDFTAGYLEGNPVVGGTMNWWGGALWINGSLSVGSNGVLNFVGPGDKYLYSPLTNAGTVVWTGTGNIHLGDYYNYNWYGAPIYNLAGALFDVQSDQTLFNDPSGAQPFSNAGVLRKSAGSASSFINVPLLNTGTVQAQSGMLVFQGGGTLDGTFGASNSAGMTFANGTFNLRSGNPANTGSGPIQFGAAAYLAFSGPITNFDFTAGFLTGDAVVSGTMNWSGGALWINSSLSVASSGVLNLLGPADKSLYSPLTNAGTVAWSGTGNIDLGYYYNYGWYFAPIYNLAGATFDMQSDQALLGPGIADAEPFSNAGLLRKSVGTGMSTITVPLTNTGTIEVDSGNVRIDTYSGDPGATLALALGGPGAGTGYGQLQFASPVVFSGNLTVRARNNYLPNPGDSFQVLSFPSATGSFDCMQLDLGAGRLLEPEFAPTSLGLLTVTYPTNATAPSLFITRAPGGLLVSWPLGFPDWTLQTSTNLPSQYWAPVAAACGNQAFVPIAGPQQYFRMSKPTPRPTPPGTPARSTRGQEDKPPGLKAAVGGSAMSTTTP